MSELELNLYQKSLRFIIESVNYLDSKYPDFRTPGSCYLITCIEEHIKNNLMNEHDLALATSLKSIYIWTHQYEHDHFEELH